MNWSRWRAQNPIPTATLWRPMMYVPLLPDQVTVTKATNCIIESQRAALPLL
jgi:hypothetical protein